MAEINPAKFKIVNICEIDERESPDKKDKYNVSYVIKTDYVSDIAIDVEVYSNSYSEAPYDANKVIIKILRSLNLGVNDLG